MKMDYPPFLITTIGMKQIFLKYCTIFAALPLDGARGIPTMNSRDCQDIGGGMATATRVELGFARATPRLARITHVGSLAKEKREYRD